MKLHGVQKYYLTDEERLELDIHSMSVEQLRDELKYCTMELRRLEKALEEAGRMYGYKMKIPKPGMRILKTSGIYFVWRSGEVVYVGKSKNVYNRVNRNHHIIKAGDGLSFIKAPKERLITTESFYIGILKPIFNQRTPQP